MDKAGRTRRVPARLVRSELTVACVYRSGSTLYSPRYIEVLWDMVARHVTVPYRFVCLSDVAVPCDRIPLITDWPGFYSKIELFRPGLFEGPVLYFDLDTVIHGNCDELAKLASELEFGCVSDPLGGHMNSSVMTFTADCSFIFERFGAVGRLERASRKHLWLALRHVGLARPVSWGSSYGDQGFSEMCLRDAGIPIAHLDRLLPGHFSTFRFTANAKSEPASRVCLMMDRPKPHEITAGWVTDHWRTNSDPRLAAASKPNWAPEAWWGRVPT
jgi:hypothetical protein